MPERRGLPGRRQRPVRRQYRAGEPVVRAALGGLGLPRHGGRAAVRLPGSGRLGAEHPGDRRQPRGRGSGRPPPAGIYFAVQASYEQQIVNANQQALNSAVQQYKAAYVKELKKLPSLLKTAKANKFPKIRPTRKG
jgi:hypothetical protein